MGDRDLGDFVGINSMIGVRSHVSANVGREGLRVCWDPQITAGHLPALQRTEARPEHKDRTTMEKNGWLSYRAWPPQNPKSWSIPHVLLRFNSGGLGV